MVRLEVFTSRKLEHQKTEELKILPKKFFPNSIEALAVNSENVLSSVKDFGVVYSKISDSDKFEFKEVYMKGLEAEKSIKFDHFDESKFYSITNKNDLLVGDLENPAKSPSTVKLHVARPIELALNKQAPTTAAVIDAQGVIEM